MIVIKIGLIKLEIERRFKKLSQFLKSDYNQVCIDPYVQTEIILILI